MENVFDLLFTLLRYLLTGEKLTDAQKEKITPTMLEELYSVTSIHDISHLMGEALYKNGLLSDNDEVSKKFNQARYASIYRYTHQDYVQEKIFNLFEKNGITFVALKGSVIRDYYPEPYMRTSCDIDILVLEEQLSKAKECLQKELNFAMKTEENYHDISFLSPEGVHIELHFSLLERFDRIDIMLKKVWENVVDISGSLYQKVETPEYFMFHHIAHMLHHFVNGGCGIRPFFDFYLLQKKMPYDEAKLLKLLRKCNIVNFYNIVKEISAIWFEAGEHNEMTKIIENFILNGGIYGSTQNKTTIQQNFAGNKLNYMIKRLFLPYNILKYRYPVIIKHKWLFPFATVLRWIEALAPRKRQVAKTEIETLKTLENNNEIIQMLKFLEL